MDSYSVYYYESGSKFMSTVTVICITIYCAAANNGRPPTLVQQPEAPLNRPRWGPRFGLSRVESAPVLQRMLP